MRWQWLFPLVLGCATAGAADEICGYVYSVRGDWRLAPQFAVALKPGMELHAGDKIKLMTEARPAHINAGLLNGTLWKQDCDSDGDCRDALALPGVAPGATLPERLRKLIAGFGSHPSPVVFTLSRGGEGEPREAVLHLVGNQTDLAPALRGMGSVRLTARLVPLVAGSPTTEASCQEAQTGSGCLLPPTAAGLYKLEVRAGDRETQTVLVLVAADGDYRRLDETFAEARRVADSWGNGAHPDARHYFLSACLEELARTAGKAR